MPRRHQPNPPAGTGATTRVSSGNRRAGFHRGQLGVLRLDDAAHGGVPGGRNAWAVQVRDGMQVTNMSDHVSWGLYIANFTFLVGLAAGGVMMVIPAYLYHDEEMHDVVIIGELLAIAAIIMA
jgi:hypothetical protein